MAVNTYYFDGSLRTRDLDTVWTDDANAFDGSTSTFATTSTLGGHDDSSLWGIGTNAPTGITNITQVRARIYGSVTNSLDELIADIYILDMDFDGPLGQPLKTGSGTGWGDYVVLTAPRGGWNSYTLKHLAAEIYNFPDAGAAAVNAYRVEIEVTTGEPLISTLKDDFDDNSFSTSKWTGSYGTVTETGGKLEIACTSGYSGFVSNGFYDLTGSSMFAEITRPSIGTGTTQAYFQLNQDANNGLIMVLENTLLYLRVRTTGSNSDTSITYSATDHKWWRIRENAGSVYFDTSPDKITWTNRRTVATPSFVTSVAVDLSSGYYGSESSPTPFIIDNFNITNDYLIDFEDDTVFPLNLSGSVNWSVSTTTNNAPNSNYVLVSGAIANDQSSNAAITVDVGAGGGNITFEYSASSELDYDYLQFIVDGEPYARWSGLFDWDTFGVQLTEGIHTIEFAYDKDTSSVENNDKAYLDNIFIENVKIIKNTLFHENFEGVWAAATLQAFNGGSATNWTASTINEYAGDYCYRSNNAAAHVSRYTTTVHPASDEFNLEGWVYCEVGGTNLAGLAFGHQASGSLGYQILVDTRNGTGGSASFHLRKDASATVLASSTAATVSSATWYRIAVQWRTSGTRISCQLYDTSGTQLATLTSTDASYTTGRLGLHAYEAAKFDNISLIGNTTVDYEPTKYWIGGGGSWTDTANWSLTSGGTGGAIAPSKYNDVVINSSSGFGSGGTITVTDGYCKNFTSSSGHTYTIGSFSSDFMYVHGNLTLEAGLTFLGTIQMSGPSEASIDMAGATYARDIDITGSGRKYLLSNLLRSIDFGSYYDGFFDANGFDVGTSVNSSIQSYPETGATHTLHMGSGTFTTSSEFGAIEYGGTFLIDPGTSTLITKTSYLDFYNFTATPIEIYDFVWSTNTDEIYLYNNLTVHTITEEATDNYHQLYMPDNLTVTGELDLQGQPGNLTELVAPLAVFDEDISTSDLGPELLYTGSITRVGQSFTVTSETNLARIWWRIRKTGVPTGTVVAKLYAHSGTFGTSSVPTGTALYTSTTSLDISTLTTSYGGRAFLFDYKNTSLSPDTKYVATIEYSGGNSTNRLDVSGHGDNHSGNASSFNGSWSAIAAKDLYFQVQTRTPSTITKTSGVVSVDYLDIYNSQATGGAVFYAGSNSVDSGLNTGWIFADPILQDSLFNNSNTFYASNVQLTVNQDSIFNNINTYFTGELDSYVAQNTLFTNTNSFYTGELAIVIAVVQNSSFINTNTYYAGTVTPQEVVISLATRFDGANTFYSGTAVYTQNISSVLFNNTNTFYSPSITLFIVGDTLYENSNTFFESTVDLLLKYVQAGLFVNTSEYYQGSVLGKFDVDNSNMSGEFTIVSDSPSGSYTSTNSSSSGEFTKIQ